MNDLMRRQYLPLLLMSSLVTSIPALASGSSTATYLILNGNEDYSDDSQASDTLLASKSDNKAKKSEVTNDFIITEALHPDGFRVKRYLGPVIGLSVRFPAICPLSFSRAFTGGRADNFEKAYLRASEEAKEAMVTHAKELGANAVLGARFTSLSTWVGDAVVIEPIDQAAPPKPKDEG